MGKRAKKDKPLPSPDTVVSEFEVPMPGGKVRRVIRTNQVDEYEEAAPAPKKQRARRPPKGRRKKS